MSGRMRTYIMRLMPLFLLLLGTALPLSSHAAGTAAGTAITVQATVVFDIGAATGLTMTASSSFLVDRKVNLTVAATNATYMSSTAGSLAQVLSFTVTNTGNDVQDFDLAATHGSDPFGGTDNFDAANVQVFAESGATAGYQAAQDTATYIDELAPDAGRTVYIVSDIPAGRVSGDISAITLVATARTGGGPGALGGALTETAGADTPGVVDTVFTDAAGDTDAARDAAHSDTSAYRVSSVNVSLLKSAVVSDPFGGNRPQTGATIRYTIFTTVSGAGTAAAVTISDPIPANTTYRPGTLRLNGVLLSDAADADAGDVGFTAPGAVTVRLGDLTSASPAQTVTFEVTIN